MNRQLQYLDAMGIQAWRLLNAPPGVPVAEELSVADAIHAEPSSAPETCFRRFRPCALVTLLCIPHPFRRRATLPGDPAKV